MKFSQLRDKQRVQLKQSLYYPVDSNRDFGYQYLTKQEIDEMFTIHHKCGDIYEYTNGEALCLVSDDDDTAIIVDAESDIDETIYLVLP